MGDDDAADGAGAAPTFTLGLAMAGAISAGAYTAGVLDFLARALEAHNAAVGTEGGPRHRIAIKAVSGASAGGVCAALGVLAFAQDMAETGVPAVAPDGTAPGTPAYVHVLRPLHDIWVNRLDLAAGPDPLLGERDLARGGELVSLLDAGVLDRQADAALAEVRPEAGARRSWLAQELELFLTATLLDGVPYTAPFSQEDAAPDPGGRIAGHPMADHALVRHFRLHGLGDAAIPSPWLEAWGDDGIPLRLPEGAALTPEEAAASLIARLRDPNDDWGQFLATALATGAFPGGLRSRPLRLAASEVYLAPDRVAAGERARGGARPMDMDWDARPAPSHPDFLDPELRRILYAVDGGVANNEPFELVRFALRPRNPAPHVGRERFLSPNPPGAREADRAVLMIDPFPEGPEYPGADATRDAGLLLATLGKLAPALLNQARFKPRELLRAADAQVHSRYLIAPSRRARSGELDGLAPDDRRRGALGADGAGARGAQAIACGALGGFGGFLDRSFRAHDFILGQRNCRSFLLNHFGVHRDNPVFAGWTGGRAQGDDHQALVHLPEALAAEIPLPPWPLLTRTRFDRARRRIDARVDAAMAALLREQLPKGWLRRTAAGLGYRFVLAPKIKAALHRAVAADLGARDQIQPPRR